MKKIALILALLVALSCCAVALASCGEEEASSEAPAASSEAPAASSEAPAASSEEEPAASSEEPAPSEEPSEEPSEDPTPVESGEDNLALGKTYTTSPLMRQGGAEVSWAYDENAPVSYPDEDGVTLTDGVRPTGAETYSDPVWAGFHAHCPDYTENGFAWILVDLGESHDLAKFVMNAGSKQLGSGISAPTKVKVLVSDDGETFTEVGEVSFVDTEEVNNVDAILEAAASGRYVKFEITSPGWMFITEVEVYENVATAE